MGAAATHMKPQRSHPPFGVILLNYFNRHTVKGESGEGGGVVTKGAKKATFQTAVNGYSIEETCML